MNLAPPPLSLLPRPRLAAEAPTPVLLLVAGAGAGKTCAARAIAEAWSLPVAWLEGRAAGRLGAAELAEQLAEAYPAGLTLVVDGLEAGGPDALRFLADWLTEPQRARHTLVTARELPAIPLARRMAKGEVKLLGPEALFLDAEELAAWGAPAESMAMGGWPLGVQALIEAPEGGARLAAALVDEEWLAPLPEALLEAAGVLSLLPWLDASAPGAEGAEALARWGFLRALPGRYAWVPDARARVLKACDARLAAATRGAAEAWLAERDPEGAIAALVARGAHSEAAELAARTGAGYRKTGEIARLTSLLATLPLALRTSSPALDLLDGAVRLAAGDHAEAEARFERAASASEAARDPAGTFEALGDLLHLHWTRQDIPAFERVAARIAPLEPAAAYAERIEYFNNLACYHFGRGEEAEARRLYKRVLDYPHFEDPQVASVQQFASINLGILAKEAGVFDEAARHLERVLELAARFALKPSVPRGARLYLAAVALALGERHKAEAAFAALAASPFPAEERYRQAELLTVEGDYFLLTGDYGLAEARYQEALAAFAAIRMEEGAAAGMALNKLAVLYRRRGELDSALRQHAKALGMVKDWPRDKAVVLHDWAITLMQAGELEMADARMLAAFEVLDATEAPHLTAAVRMASAVLAARLGQADHAQRRLEAGLELIRQGPYYYVAIAQRELAPELWALMAKLGHTAMLGRIEAHFPAAAERIRAAMTPATGQALPPVAPPALSIRTFGTLEVEVAGEPVKTWPRKKVRALLALLLLTPRGFARDELAEQLFPDLGIDESEHQLDNLASALRKLLEPGLERRQKSRYLLIKDRHYRFEGEGVEVDCLAFEARAKAGQLALSRGDVPGAIEAYEGAIALYRDDLLSEPMLLEWFDLERLRFRTRARELLGWLGDQAFAAGHYEGARAHAERLVALDPTSEDGHRRLMAIYGHFGQRDLVSRQYELCRRILKEQLDAEPDTHTRRLYQELTTRAS